MRRKVNSFKLLTPDDKKYLRRVCRYLASLGMQDGNIEIDVETGYDFEFSDIEWDTQVTHFSNNYNADIPDGLIDILKKIAGYIQEKDLFKPIDIETVNWERIDFDIDCERQEISVNHWYSYYDRGSTKSRYYGGEDGKEMFEEWESDGVFEDLTIPKNGILTVKYNGSGDSGYIESSFDETYDSVPGAIEDWCYRELEDNFGGWEINEGSDGEFIFNFHQMTIELVHTYNTEENSTDTIYEESFSE